MSSGIDANSMEDLDGGLEDNAELALALRLSMESGGSGSVAAVNDASANDSGLAPNLPLENIASGPVLGNPSVVQELNSGVSGFQPPDDSSGSNREGDSAIDAAFLAELPEELRAEVIAQQSSQGGRWPGGAVLRSNPGFLCKNDASGVTLL
jgi:hypothetical protein